MHSVSLYANPYRVMFRGEVGVDKFNLASLCRNPAAVHTDVDILFDTGCTNTLLPYQLWTDGFARKLKLTKKVTVAGFSGITVTGYVLDKLTIGKFTLTDVLGFSHESFIEGEFMNIILGANVFQRWRSTQDFHSRRFEFSEESGTSRETSYFRYFDDKGKLVFLAH